MVDTQGYIEIEKMANRTRDAVQAGKWTDATQLWAITECTIIKITGNIDFYNILTRVNDKPNVPFCESLPITQGNTLYILLIFVAHWVIIKEKFDLVHIHEH